MYGLVTCAGIRQTSAPVASFPYERWQRVMEVDVSGTFLSCRAAAARMIGTGTGSIVTIGSTSAILPRIGQSAYCVAKAGVAAFTKVLALELAGSGIRANCVSPGSTATGMVDLWDSPIESSVQDRIHGNLERFRAGVPMRRLARPEEVADSVVFLLSPRSSYITGHILAVDTLCGTPGGRRDRHHDPARPGGPRTRRGGGTAGRGEDGLSRLSRDRSARPCAKPQNMMEGGSIGLGRPPYRSSQCPGVGPTKTGWPWRTISAGIRQAPIVPSGWTTTLATVVWALTGLMRRQTI